MAEKWKENLRSKFDGYESADIPDGLWAGIESRLDAAEPVAQSTKPKRAFSLVWSRSAVAVILLMVALNCGMMRCFYTYFEGEADANNVSLASDNLLNVETRRASRARVAEIGRGEILSKTDEDKDSVSAEKTEVKAVTVSSAPSQEKKDSVVENNVRSEKKKVWYVSKNSANISKTKKAKQKPSVSMFVSGITVDTDFLDSGDYYATAPCNSNPDIPKPDNPIPDIPNPDDGSGCPDCWVADPGFDDWEDVPPSDDGDSENSDTRSARTPIPGKPKIDGSGYGNTVEKEYEEHSRPIYFGLEVAFPLDDKWSFQTGLVYCVLCSDFDKGAVHTDQTISYLNVPLKVGVNLAGGKKWNIYASGGMMVGFGVSGKAEILKPSASNGRVSMTQRLNDIPVTASVVASPGLEFRLFRSLNAYAEPSLMFNIPTGRKYHTFNTENPFVLNFGLGLRYKIGK
jgi:hypothetical protein